MRNISRTAVLMCSAAMLVAMPFAAIAQNADEAESDLDAIVLSTDRQGGQILDQTGNVTVVSDEELKAHNVTDMKELTRYTPGITTSHQTTGTDPYNTFGGFNIRGVGGNRVQMQVDGSRVPERITDGTRDYIDFSFTKQVEIVRGPASVLWGADALGGVVALETLDPEDVLKGRDSGGSVSFSHDTVNSGSDVDFLIAQKLSPTVDVMVGFSRSVGNEMKLSNARDDGGTWGCPRPVTFGASTCGELNPSDTTSSRALAKLVWTPTDTHRLEFSVDMLDRETTVDNRYNRGPALNSFTGLPTGSMNLSDDRQLNIKRQRYAIEHDWTGGGIIDSVKTTLAFSPNSYDSKSWKAYSNRAGDFFNSYRERGYSEEFLELDIQATSSFTLGSTEHNVVFGFDGDRTNAKRSPFDRVTNVTTGTETETDNGGFKFANSTTTRADVYIQDTITFGGGRLELTPGLRYATYNIDPKTYPGYALTTGALPEARKGKKLVKSLGATYRFDSTYSIWGKYSEGFKMPTAQQLYSSSSGFFSAIPAPNLLPEEVVNLEVGLRGEYERGFFSVNAFHADYSNFIQGFYFPDPAVYEYTNRNIRDVKVWGLEASGEYEINDVLTTNFTVAYQKGRQRATPTSAQTPFNVSPFSGTIGLAYYIPQADLKLEALGTFSAAFKENSSSTGFKPHGYAVLDLYATWKPTNAGKFVFGIQNVFDRRYFNAGAANYQETPAYSAVALTNPLELQTGTGRTFQFAYEMEF